MSFIDLSVDLDRLTGSVERIEGLLLRLVQAIERLSPPVPDQLDMPPVRPATVEDIGYTDDQHSALVSAGALQFAKIHSVVPDSESFQAAMVQYEQEMKAAYGPEAKVDWEEIFLKLAKA